MNIELRNIKLSQHLYAGANPFTAEVYIDDKFVGVALSKGAGHSTSVDFVNQSAKHSYMDADSWLKAENLKNTQSVLLLKDGAFIQERFAQILSNHIKELEAKNFWNHASKSMEYGLLYGVPENHYLNISFRNPIRHYLMNADLTHFFIELATAHISRKYEPEHLILNHNIDSGIKTEIIDRAKYQAVEGRLVFANRKPATFDPTNTIKTQKGL